MRGADGVDQRIDMTGGMLPDFVAQARVTIGPVGVVQLIGPPVAGLLADLTSFGNHRLNQALGDPFVVAEHDR